MTFAQYEREVIAERVRDKIAGAKRRGKFCGGTPVLGYDSDPKTKKLVVNEPEAELVRKIFRLYSRLGSGPDVVRELNRQGEQTKSYVTRKGRVREGRKFRIDHVWRILNNPLYIGQVHHKGKTFPGEHKAIINERDWELVHTMLKSNTTAKRKSKFDTAYPLKGLIRCGYCDSGMTTTYTKNGNRRYIYLNCVKSRKNPEHCCPLGQIPGREFEKTVLQQLGALFRTPSILAKTYQAATENAAEERELLLKKRDELTCRSEKLLQEMSQLVDEGSNEDLVLRNKQKQKVDRELKKIKKHLQILSSETLMQTEIVEAFNRVEELWDELFPGEKHRLCRLFIENIVLFRDNMEIEIKTNALNSLVSELTSSILKGSKYGSTDLHSPPE
jgi:site-specific DNA recombinase